MPFSTIRDSLSCPFCQLEQFERGNGRCRRCHRSLGFTYIEFATSTDQFHPDFLRREIGSFMRFLRSRSGVTQSELSSRTGIHRTYLSRVECGQIVPSILAVMRIAQALGMDKVFARLRTPQSSTSDSNS